ncbi:hybrid-cluster NAD(P)-dependent oxidoreductase [Nocardioides insulae]|uniref:hybrid-cluster NAD(P)-dependent oxidoreductase n=1 Tax=Nocardioides insulae TaxID=394734 RepID=UPI0004036ED1|nr:hybrid-cluster NAD(P)-dependent oxidoreductase [Nocardioides insulae]
MTELLSPGYVGHRAPRPRRPLVEEVDGSLTCVAIRPITHDVVSFDLLLPDDAVLAHAPGQYLTFTFEVGGQPMERCYTLSSAPPVPGHQPEVVTITVKRTPDGPVSAWLHDHLRVGDRVRAVGPFGEFSHTRHPAARYLFLSAGSGITPLMSMTRALGETADPADVVFVHSARTPADIVFRDELARIAERADRSVTVLCEGDAPGEAWTGVRGRLTAEALLAAAPDLLEREVFTCGPPAYMEAVRETLDLLGVDPSRRHEESFRLGALTRESADPELTGERHRIELRRTGRTIECDGSATVLEAALEAGVSLPSSCEEGACGTCKATLLEGRVDMQHAGGIRPREIQAGKFLPCCSKPLDDLVIDA